MCYSYYKDSVYLSYIFSCGSCDLFLKRFPNLPVTYLYFRKLCKSHPSFSFFLLKVSSFYFCLKCLEIFSVSFRMSKAASLSCSLFSNMELKWAYAASCSLWNNIYLNDLDLIHIYMKKRLALLCGERRWTSINFIILIASLALNHT